jgi:hypothetical protein
VDPAWKREILQEAFEMAGAAKYPVALVGAVEQAGDTDSDAGIRWAALQAKLDTLLLRSRIVSDVLSLNPHEAVELFRDSPVVQFPALVCEDALRPAPAIFFQTLGQVVERGFTAKEVADGKPIDFAETYLSSLVSPAQLEPAMHMIATNRLTGDGMERLAGALASGLQQIGSDDRTFASATNSAMIQALIELVHKGQQTGYPPQALISGFRAYLVRHFEGALCAESVDAGNQFNPMSGIVAQFNQTLRLLAAGAPISPITPEETQPASVGAAAKVYLFWTKPQSAKLMADYKRLRFGSKEQEEANRGKRRPDGMAPLLTEDQRQTPEWQAAAQQFLTSLEEWKQDNDEPAESYFHEVCFMYKGLLDIVPAGSLRDGVLDSYIGFLKNSEVEHGSPPEWYLQVSRLIKGTIDASEQERSRIRRRDPEAG